MVLLIVLSHFLIPQCVYSRGPRQWISFVAVYSLIFATSFWTGYYSSVVNNGAKTTMMSDMCGGAMSRPCHPPPQQPNAPVPPLVLYHPSLWAEGRRNDSLVSWLMQIDDGDDNSVLTRVPFSSSLDYSMAE